MCMYLVQSPPLWPKWSINPKSIGGAKSLDDPDLTWLLHLCHCFCLLLCLCENCVSGLVFMPVHTIVNPVKYK